MKKAFTLIELLVVIAIIAILAAILFPVFAQAKEAAKKTTCLANTKQIALGLYMYAGDADDTLCQTSWEQEAAGGYPGTYNPANPVGQYQVHWTFLIQPYIKNWGIFVCPSDPAPVKTDNPACSTGQSGAGQLTNGLMTCDWEAELNSYIPVYNAMPAHDWTVVGFSAFNSPSSQIVVAEHRNDGITGNQHKGTSGFQPSQPCPNWPIVAYPASGKAYAKMPAADTLKQLAIAAIGGYAANPKQFKNFDILRVAFDRHTSGQNANYSFADGHAKNMSLGATLDPNNYLYGDHWYPNSQPWNSSPCQ